MYLSNQKTFKMQRDRVLRMRTSTYVSRQNIPGIYLSVELILDVKIF